MRTTNRGLCGLVAAALGGVIISSASATPLSALVSSDPDYRNGAGGEFTVWQNQFQTPLGLGGYTAGLTRGVVRGPQSFQTFCLEESNPLIFGNVDFHLSGAADNGGNNQGNPGNPGGNPDPISLGTAFLYSAFASGELGLGNTYNLYDYTPGLNNRVVSAGLLQEAIWFLEDEIPLANPLTNPFINLAVGTLGGLANAVGDSNGAYDVFAMNIAPTSFNDDPQDLLYIRTPDGGASVMLLGLALSGIGIFRRLSA